jgi:hypothetical protein
MVRNGYFLQDGESFKIFDGSMDQMSLVGFQALPEQHVIRDWGRFFPDSSKEEVSSGDTFHPAPGVAAGSAGRNNAADDAPGSPRLQFAYRIDTSVANPLAALPAVVASDPPPSLIVRNLWRGAAFQLPTGQDFERKLGVALPKQQLMVRDQLAASGEKSFKYRPVDPMFSAATPLWFYILAEAQRDVIAKFGTDTFTESQLRDNASQTGTQLGEVGGGIVLEVFHGLLDSDPDSYRNHPDAASWKPRIKKFRMWDIVTA